MAYIRTKKNNYNLDIIIDITTDENFVVTSGLEWTSIDSGSPQIGDYYYDGMFINLESENYHIIEEIIFSEEEPKRIAREEEEAKLLEERLKQSQENPLPPPEPIIFEDTPIDPRELPKPIAAPYSDVELNQENYAHWNNANTNLGILIDALENGNPTVSNENKTATFETPVEFADGVTQIEFGFPDDTFQEYLQYLKDTDGYQKELLVRLKIHLGISTT